MSPWLCMIIIFFAGGLGGIVNALLNREGLLLPCLIDTSSESLS